MRIASSILTPLARFFPAMSIAVPWSTDVRKMGMPPVTAIVRSKSRVLAAMIICSAGLEMIHWMAGQAMIRLMAMSAVILIFSASATVRTVYMDMKTRLAIWILFC